jgi:hypothetical protein
MSARRILILLLMVSGCGRMTAEFLEENAKYRRDYIVLADYRQVHQQILESVRRDYPADLVVSEISSDRSAGQITLANRGSRDVNALITIAAIDVEKTRVITYAISSSYATRVAPMVEPIVRTQADGP